MASQRGPWLRVSCAPNNRKWNRVDVAVLLILSFLASFVPHVHEAEALSSQPSLETAESCRLCDWATQPNVLPLDAPVQVAIHAIDEALQVLIAEGSPVVRPELPLLPRPPPALC